MTAYTILSRISFFFQAEDGIRYYKVTGVQTCALPIFTPGAGIGEEQRVRDARTRAATYEVEIQKKYAIAAACLVFALVGIPVALRFQRGGVGLVIGMSVGGFTVYYVGLIAGQELGDRLLVSPFLAMWTPNL